MINSILQATQIGAGKISVVKEETNLNEFLAGIRSGYDLPLNKPIKLHWQYPAEFSVITIDSEKLKHILQNIIDNAIKFTEKGTITISVQRKTRPDEVEFKIRDTGVGIPTKMLPTIFEMFRQADSSENRPFEGVGLGLYIVKKFSELLGGNVEVESEEGRGSTFTVTLPCNSLPETIPGVSYNAQTLPDYPNREF
jgi:signal transduction histidine kinase